MALSSYDPLSCRPSSSKIKASDPSSRRAQLPTVLLRVHYNLLPDARSQALSYYKLQGLGFSFHDPFGLQMALLLTSRIHPFFCWLVAARATNTRVRSSGFGERCGTFLVNVTLSATERLILCVKQLAEYESGNRGGKPVQPPRLRDSHARACTCTSQE